MTDVDTSIYKSTVPPINPLQQYGQVVGIQNAQQQNRLLQQQQDLRAGMGAAAQNATDPATGKFDPNRLLDAVRQDPRTSWNFGDINQQTQANVQATAQAQKAQLENGLAHVQAANSVISGVLGTKGLGTVDMKKQIAGAVVSIMNSDGSMLSPELAIARIKEIPDDPAGQLAYVQQHANQNLALQGKLEQVLGTPQAISTGDTTNIVRTGVAGGAPQVVGALANTLSPGEKVQGQSTVAPNGQAGTVPVGTRFDRFGNVLGGSAAPAAPAAAPAATPPLGRVNALATPVAPSGGAPAPAAASSGAPAGFLPTAQPPGFEPSQNADVAKYKADQALIPTRVTNVQSLQKAQIALEALSGPLGTGKGTDTLAHMKSVMSSLGIAFNDSTLNRDQAKKYLTDYARSQGAAAHSDLQLQAAQGSNASTDISNAAALDVVKTNIGRERQAMAQVMEHQNPTGIGYGAHATNFANTTDPRAFAADQYTPAELKKMTDAMKPAELDKFHKSLEIAAKYHLIKTGR